MEIGGAVNLMGNASITELFSLLSIRFNFPRSSAPPRGRLNQDDTVVGQATERRIARYNSDCAPPNCRHDEPRFSRSLSMAQTP